MFCLEQVLQRHSDYVYQSLLFSFSPNSGECRSYVCNIRMRKGMSFFILRQSSANDITGLFVSAAESIQLHYPTIRTRYISSTPPIFSARIFLRIH